RSIRSASRSSSGIVAYMSGGEDSLILGMVVTESNQLPAVAPLTKGWATTKTHNSFGKNPVPVQVGASAPSLASLGTPHPHRNRPPRRPRQRRAHAIAQQRMLHQREARQRQARPHRHAEIKRHPGDLVAPGRDVVGDDPAGGEVVQAGDEAEIVLAGG